MTQAEFLNQKVFTGLINHNNTKDHTDFALSEEDFATVLVKAEYYGIAIYEIKTTLHGKHYKTINHESFRKKATDADWYKKEFKHLKRLEEGLLYTATYKVSKKLLNKNSV
jgi:hypothetical protein